MMSELETNELNNSELLQNTRVFRLDINQKLVALLMEELARINNEAGHEVMGISDAVNDALATYIVNLKSHDFARLN